MSQNNTPTTPHGGPISFKTVPNRNKTQKWTRAAAVNYDGDDWGEDPYEDMEGYGGPPPPPPPAAAPRPRQDAPPPMPTNAAFQLPSQRPHVRTNSFERGDDGARSVSAPFPTYDDRRSAGPASASSSGGRGSNDFPRSRSRPRDFTNPEHAPSPLNTHSQQPVPHNAPAPEAWFPPRKSSLSGNDYASEAQATEARAIAQSITNPATNTGSANVDKPLPFIRPSDIYKRIPDELKRQSEEGGRPSTDSLQRVTSGDLNPSLTPVAEVRESKIFTEDDAPSTFRPIGERSRDVSPSLPPVERFSTFGDDIFSKAITTSSESSHPAPSLTTAGLPVSRIQDSSNQNTPTITRPEAGHDPAAEILAERQQEDGLQHQPSVGLLSAVNQAFDTTDGTLSRDGSQSQSGSGVGRSDTNSTAGISPIMSHVPSTASAFRRDEQVPTIAEESVPTPTASSAQKIPRKPSPSHSRNPSADHSNPEGFEQGYRRSLDLPSTGSSPARTPGLEHTSAKRLSTGMAGVVSTDEEFDAPGHSTTTSVPLPITGRGRSGTDYSTREADLVDEIKSSPEQDGSMAAVGHASKHSQDLFLQTHNVQTPTSSATGTPVVERPNSPTKGRVREIADQYSDIHEASRRNSAASMGSSKSGWSKFSDEDDKPKLRKTGTSQSQLAQEVKPESSTTGLAAPRPDYAREESFRPDLPGGWINSAAPTPATESPPVHVETTARDVEDDNIDLTPTTKKYALPESTPTGSSRSPLDQAKDIGTQLAASIVGSYGVGHQTRDFASKEPPAPVNQPEFAPRTATGALQPPLLRHETGDSSDPPASVASSYVPSPAANDGSFAHKNAGYFNNTVAPLRVRSREPSPEHLGAPGTASRDESSNRPAHLSHISSDAGGSEQESDRLNKEIMRSLENTDDVDRTQVALDAPVNERRIEQGMSALPAAEATRSSLPRPGMLNTRFSWEQKPDGLEEASSPEIKPKAAYERPRDKQLHIMNPEENQLSPDSPVVGLPQITTSTSEGLGVPDVHRPEAAQAEADITRSLSQRIRGLKSTNTTGVSPITKSQEHLLPETTIGPGSPSQSFRDIAPPSISDQGSPRIPSYYAGAHDYDQAIPPPPEKDSSNASSMPVAPSPTSPESRAKPSPGPVNIPPFRNILALKTPGERIQTYDSTRQTFANMNTGLDDWLLAMTHQHPDVQAASAKNQPPPLVQTPSASAAGGPANWKRGHRAAAPSLAGLKSRFASGSEQGGQGPAVGGLEPSDTAASRPAGSSPGGPAIDMDRVQQRGKEIMKGASVFGGKTAAGAKGLFAKGKNKWGGSVRRGSEKEVPTLPSSATSTRRLSGMFSSSRKPSLAEEAASSTRLVAATSSSAAPSPAMRTTAGTPPAPGPGAGESTHGRSVSAPFAVFSTAEGAKIVENPLNNGDGTTAANESDSGRKRRDVVDGLEVGSAPKVIHNSDASHAATSGTLPNLAAVNLGSTLILPPPPPAKTTDAWTEVEKDSPLDTTTVESQAEEKGVQDPDGGVHDEAEQKEMEHKIATRRESINPLTILPSPVPVLAPSTLPSESHLDSQPQQQNEAAISTPGLESEGHSTIQSTPGLTPGISGPISAWIAADEKGIDDHVPTTDVSGGSSSSALDAQTSNSRDVGSFTSPSMGAAPLTPNPTISTTRENATTTPLGSRPTTAILPTNTTTTNLHPSSSRNSISIPLSALVNRPDLNKSSSRTGSPFQKRDSSSTRSSSRPLSGVFGRLREFSRSSRGKGRSTSRPASVIFSADHSSSQTNLARSTTALTDFSDVAVDPKITTPAPVAALQRRETWNEPEAAIPVQKPKTPTDNPRERFSVGGGVEGIEGVGRIGILPSPAPTTREFDERRSRGLSRGEEEPEQRERGDVEPEAGNISQAVPKDGDIAATEVSPPANPDNSTPFAHDLQTRLQNATQGQSPQQRKVSDLVTLPSHRRNMSDVVSPITTVGHSRNTSQMSALALVSSGESGLTDAEFAEASPLTIKPADPVVLASSSNLKNEAEDDEDDDDDLYDSTPVAKTAPRLLEDDDDSGNELYESTPVARTASKPWAEEIAEHEREIVALRQHGPASQSIERWEDARSEVSAEDGARRESHMSDLERTTSRTSSVSSMGAGEGVATPVMPGAVETEIPMSAQAVPAGPIGASPILDRDAPVGYPFDEDVQPPLPQSTDLPPSVSRFSQPQRQQQHPAANRQPNMLQQRPQMAERPLSYMLSPRDDAGYVQEQISTAHDRQTPPVDISAMSGPPPGAQPFGQHPAKRGSGFVSPSPYDQIRLTGAVAERQQPGVEDLRLEGQQQDYFRGAGAGAVPHRDRISDQHGLEDLHGEGLVTPSEVDLSRPQTAQQQQQDSKQRRRSSGLWQAFSSRRSSSGTALAGSGHVSSSADVSGSPARTPGLINPISPGGAIQRMDSNKPKTLQKPQRANSNAGDVDPKKKARFSGLRSLLGRSSTSAGVPNKETNQTNTKDDGKKLKKVAPLPPFSKLVAHPNDLNTVQGAVMGYDDYEAQRKRAAEESAYQQQTQMRERPQSMIQSTLTSREPPSEGWYAPGRGSTEQPVRSPPPLNQQSRPPDSRRLHSSGSQSRERNVMKVPEAFRPVEASFNRPVQPVGPPQGHEPPLLSDFGPKKQRHQSGYGPEPMRQPSYPGQPPLGTRQPSYPPPGPRPAEGNFGGENMSPRAEYWLRQQQRSLSTEPSVPLTREPERRPFSGGPSMPLAKTRPPGPGIATAAPPRNERIGSIGTEMARSPAKEYGDQQTPWPISLPSGGDSVQSSRHASWAYGDEGAIGRRGDSHQYHSGYSQPPHSQQMMVYSQHSGAQVIHEQPPPGQPQRPPQQHARSTSGDIPGIGVPLGIPEHFARGRAPPRPSRHPIYDDGETRYYDSGPTSGHEHGRAVSNPLSYSGSPDQLISGGQGWYERRGPPPPQYQEHPQQQNMTPQQRALQSQWAPRQVPPAQQPQGRYYAAPQQQNPPLPQQQHRPSSSSSDQPYGGSGGPYPPGGMQEQGPHHRRRYSGRRDDPTFGEEELIMRGASYPGQEWQPAGLGRVD